MLREKKLGQNYLLRWSFKSFLHSSAAGHQSRQEAPLAKTGLPQEGQFRLLSSENISTSYPQFGHL